MAELKRAQFELQKVRGGYVVDVTILDDDGCTALDRSDNPLRDEFLIAGDLNAEELGKEILASLVALNMESKPARKR